MDSNLNSLLKWGVENSAPAANEASSAPPSNRGLNGAALSSLFGGPSDADLMKESMAAILDPALSLDDKLIAFDNFEQLIENLDNANNMAPLALWKPLISCLSREESEIRMMAAWCVGTAVQNNEKSQEVLLAEGGVPPLVELATGEKETKEVRRKAIYALSSECRNFQPGMNAFVEGLEKKGRPKFGKVDASDMDAVDAIINGLRNEASKAASR